MRATHRTFAVGVDGPDYSAVCSCGALFPCASMSAGLAAIARHQQAETSR